MNEMSAGSPCLTVGGMNATILKFGECQKMVGNALGEKVDVNSM